MLTAQDQQNDTQLLLQFIKRNLKTLILYAFIGGLLAISLTLFIDKEYKSYGIVYPPSSTSIENSIDYPNFGYDVEADRLMQILESREIRDSVINKFGLATIFKVDTAAIDWKDRLFKLYYKNIKLERTTSMAVIITARTTNPVLSANIVNYIINCADSFREHLYKRNLLPAFSTATLEYNFQKQRVDSAENILLQHLQDNNLSSLLLLYSDAQLSIDIDKISAKQSASSAIGAEILAYKSLFEVAKEAKNRYLKIKKTIQNPIPKIFVVSYAEPHFKKISPSFTINGLIGAASGLLICLVVLLARKSAGNAKS